MGEFDGFACCEAPAGSAELKQCHHAVERARSNQQKAIFVQARVAALLDCKQQQL